MKQPTYLKIGFYILMLFLGLQSFAQNFVDFTPKFNKTLQGDIRLIGNNILSEHKTEPYGTYQYNHLVNMKYVDIDNDNSTFNSSSADLEIPNAGCYQIVHAGLYWGAVNRGANSESITDVKFKGPEGGYHDIKGEIIYDAQSTSTGNSYPYACYADVTSIVTGFSNNLGTYTVGNVSTGQGRTQNANNGTGHSAGWSLFIVFEDPTLPGKYITSFDGFSSVNKTNDVDVLISGFQTPPAPIPVTAKFAFAALEGDKPITGDKLKINGTTMFTADRPINNFFNSTVTKLGGGLVTNRNPNSTNTLGFDTGIMDVPNPTKKVIGNGDTSAIIRMESSQDQYFAYFFAFAVDVIQPKIVLTKIVLDDDDNDIGGQTVDLGQELNYIIGFQNKGNDDAQNMVIRDILPINVHFNYPSGLVDLPPAVSSHTYDPLTRELVFTIDKTYLKKNESPLSEIRIRVKVVESCNELNDMCSNIIQNQAFTTYFGVENPTFEISDDPSVNSNTFCALIPQATNFLADLDDCIFRENATLCADSVVLTAANGYDKYSWSTHPSGSPVIGTDQSISVSTIGTYYVHNTAVAPCQSIDQIFEVTSFVGAVLNNPVIPFADVTAECPNNGRKLPKVFLCGANDSRLIDTKITDASSIIWEKLVEGSCTTTVGDDCANESESCSWGEVSRGPTFDANQSGQFRLTLNYQGGCFNQYYFNVYQNLLAPSASVEDIICNTPGKIIIGDVPTGYEYSINGVDYQEGNEFEVLVPGAYIASVRQIGVTSNPCIFKVPEVQIRKRDFTVKSTVTQPLCYGDKGHIYVEARDVRPQYKFTLSQNGTSVNDSGLVIDNFYTFPSLDPGNYTIVVSTEDGCEFTEDVEIIAPTLLEATSSITKPITCTDGEITVYPTGGTPPYFYFINGSEDFVDNPVIPITIAGNYSVRIVDSNDCEASTSITIEANAEPVYEVNSTNILCYDSNTGEIHFDVTNANGYTIGYSIDNGNTYMPNETFSNLAAGTYATQIKYTLDGIECFSEVSQVTITQPDYAISASAGVAELAGCDPSGNGFGKIRITNPQGGTAPYQYSFNNQATWSTVNEAYVAPGTYTVYVKDANECVYAMPGIILDKKPVDPVIDNNIAIDYNCDGTASGTITVNNPENATYSYTYFLNGVENTNTADPKTFLNVPVGEHTVSVKYKLESVPTYSNLLYETFGYGNDITSPGINTTYYCFERQTAGTECHGSISINDGDYSVTSRIVKPFSTWLNPVDHTPATTPATPKGRYLAVNIGATIPTSAVLYEKEIHDIIPNQPIDFEFFAINLVRSFSNIYDPNLLIALVDASGTEISSFSTGDIPKSEKWEKYPKTPITLNPGANTSLKFIVRSNVRQTNGNDVAIDDIRVYQLPKTCIDEKSFPIIINEGKEFGAHIVNASDASCSGVGNGSIQIAVANYNTATGFQYSIDNGVNWTTETTSPFTISNLDAGDYTIMMRYDNTDLCEVTLQQTLEIPEDLILDIDTTPVTCLDNSTVKVKATGGTAPYTFELVYPDTTTALFSNGTLTDIAAGDYRINVTDANGCSTTSDVFTIDAVGTPTATLEITNACYVSGTNTSIEVTAAGGLPPYQYSINGSAFGADYIFNNLTPGDYHIILRDANGCEVNLPTQTVATQLILNAEITSELDCTPSSMAIITGTVSGGYGANTYEVAINGAAYTTEAGNPFPYAATTAGTYQFRVTDAEGCTATSEVVTVDAVETPSATTITVDATCNGNNNGSVQIIPSGGVGPYMFSFDGGTFTTTSLYSGLLAGTYAYQVRDAKSCIFDGSVTINEPTDLVVSASATTLFSCATDNTPQSAEVTIAVPTTGTAPYTYSFNGSGYTATNTYSVNDNGSSQTITYSVRDAHGCIAGDSVIIDPLNAPTDLDFTASTITCDATTSTVTLTSTNGVAPLEYETLATSPIVFAKQTSNTFAGLTPGTYVFRVTDANGCYYTESVTISPVTNIAVTGLKLSDVLCYGDNTGVIEFKVSGYATSYTSVLTSGTGTLSQAIDIVTLTDLVAGTYTLEVTDTDTGCTAIETITIEEPTAPLGITATATNIHCNNYESQITTTITGGTPNYKYAAVVAGSPAPADSDYDANPIITVNTNTGADLVWDVYVKDLNDCSIFTAVTIGEEGLPTVTAPAVDNQCNVSSGFTFTATGTGIAPLSYSINGGASYQDHGTFTVNAAGSYTITVKDGNGCTATSPTATEVFAPITVSASLTQDISCFVTPEASIDITVSGGNAPYTYEVSSDGGITYSAIPGSPYTTNTSGTYQFKVTDANGCEKVTPEVIVTPKVDPEITAVAIGQNISCNGEETGALNITIDTSKGLAPFVINVLNTTTGTDYGTQTSGLAAGDYIITVTDAKGCTDTAPVSILEPDPIVLDFDVEPITCGVGGISLGRIIINSVTGGTPNYTYHVKGVNGYDEQRTNQTGSVQFFEVVDFGLYEVIITDANGCMFLQQDILVASPPEDLDIDIVTTVDCITGGAADVSIGASSTTTGTGPFYFAVYDGAGMIWDGISGGSPTWQLGTGTPAGTSFTNLTPGVIYTFIVYDDDTKCYYYETAASPIATNSTLTADAVTADNITCVGSADGDVSFTINSIYTSDTDVSYEIFDSQSLVSTGVTGTGTVPANGSLDVEDLGPLPFGNYYVLISETSGPHVGCGVVTVPFNITESAFDLSIDATVSKNENCNALGVLSATASNGTAPYQYQVVATGGTPDLTAWDTKNTFELAEGTYDVYVRDAYGCEKFVSKSIIKDAEPTIDPVSPHCFDGTPFTITLSGTTFNGNMTYSIGGQYQTSPDFTISAAGSYTVSIKDENGCIATETFVVAPPLLLDADLDLDLTCDVDARIILNPTGGTGTYNTYEVSSDGGATYTLIPGPTFNTNTDGVYRFRVTDDQGCQAVSNDVVVTPNTTPTFTTTQTNVSCNGGANGSIMVTAANGIAPYTYSIDGLPFQTSNVFKGLTAGTYSIVVQDSKKCDSAAVVITITEPTLVGGNLDLTHSLTCGIENATQAATVTVTGSGGTAPYTYSFDGINYTTTNTYKTFEAGTVTAHVKDANGCAIDAPIQIVIDALSVPTDLDFVATPVTCLATTSTVTLTATDGIGTLNYEIISPSVVAPQTSDVFTGLTPDTYVFKVTDANGCYYTESYTIDPVTNITVSGSLVNDVSCSGGNDGAVRFEAANFSGTFSYQVNGGSVISGQTDTDKIISVTGLAVGNQTIEVTDEVTGCTETFTVPVSEPTPVALVETININAHCNFGAQVSVEASGGTAPYQYAFVLDGSAPLVTDYTESATAVLNPAISANWDVWVIDANGCTDTIDVVIATDPLPSVTVPAFATDHCNVTSGFEFTVTDPVGIAPFTYSIGHGFTSNPTFTVATPGIYTVTVKDGNGCTSAVPASIEIYPALNPSVSITKLASCDDNDGEIEVKGSGGSDSTYSYAISPTSGFITQTGGVFTGLAYSTLYTITVTDDVTGCTANVETTLEAPTPVTFTASATDVSCNGGSDGEITVTLEPGNDNPIYSYEITVGPETKAAQDSNIFTGLPAGFYTVEVRSGRNCVATELVEVIEPDLVVITGLDVKPYSCITDTNTTNYATITVTSVTGGSGNYTFYEFIRGGIIVQSGNKNTYTETDLAGGDYVIHVYDDKGCSASTTTTIAPIVILETLEIDIVDAITCTNDESIQVVVNRGGVLPTNLQYTVQDKDGSITGGVYNQTNTTGTFTGLTVGNYIITVMNMDTGCLEKTVHYVNAPNTFDLTIDSVVDVTCFSDSDGSAEVTFIDRLANPTSKAGPFSYEVFNVNDLVTAVHTGTTTNAGPVTIPNLAAGTYTVNATLINTPFCTVSKNFTITAPTAALNVTTTHSEITCVTGNNDGTISAKATGGWPGGYEYQLELVSGGIQVPFSTNAIFTNLTAGDYNVRVKDSRGCEAFAPVSLVVPPPITISVSATPSLLLCFGDTNATLTASASGGQGSNYLYTLNRVTGTPTTSGPQTSSTFTGLGAGTYSITVTDGYNCTETSAEVVITEPAKVEANLIKSISQTCLTDTELTLSATGGTGTYEYSADANFTTVSAPFTSSTTISIPQGVSGIYQYYVRDTNGCSAYVSNQIKIDPFIPLTVNLTAITSHINCYGDTNGSFIATAQGGLGNYVYTLQDASGNDISPTPVQTRPGVFVDLPAGTYTVFVESGDCDATSAQITITEPALPFDATFNTTNVVCFGETDGELDIIATGGTGTIKYAISPQLNQFFETSKFENLAPGTYQAIAQDELGCYIVHDFVITEPIPVILTLIPGSELPEICEGDLDGEFSVEISGGTLPYSVSLDNVDGPYIPGAPTQTQFDFTGLAGGNHTVFVRDALDCETEWDIEFPESVLIVPEVEVAFDCTDNLLSNSVTVTVVDNGIDPSELDYSLNGAPYQTSNIFLDVASGLNHYIDVRHTNGCIVRTALFDVDQYDPLELVLEDGGLNEIVTVTTGGAAPFEYSLNGVSYGDTSTFIIYKSGDYTVTVTDSNGCTATVTKYFEFIDVCIPNYFVPENGGWGPGCTSQYKNMTFDIFDRYGRKIATLRLGDKWDGTYNGKELPTGDYWYVVKLNDKNYDREFVGHFTLYR
ncbi:T9SS type B sorting domain-containing protein [Mariniflexile ostreae]|uniref:T9SS type B sorting domain-containing protein n=1 Tax=Mariniflexile ostreae TaxID=1520892 RepID=A0ABV5F812_9FLAO